MPQKKTKKKNALAELKRVTHSGNAVITRHKNASTVHVKTGWKKVTTKPWLGLVLLKKQKTKDKQEHEKQRAMEKQTSTYVELPNRRSYVKRSPHTTMVELSSRLTTK